ncbi:MAG TPA: hypothetical protein DCM62_04730 [Bacteroidales bacterium]|nr:hypothetical protein [Bacteroidales bacterium]
MFKKILKAIRTYYFRDAIKKVQRDKSVVGYQKAKKIGVLFECNSADDYRTILSVVRDLEKEGKSVYALVYINAKTLPTFTMAQVNFFYCLRNEFAWNLKLKNTHLFNFLNAGFDIVIDFSSGDFFPLKYLVGLCVAQYRVGFYHEEYIEVFDLMVQDIPGQPIELRIENIFKTIKMITPASHDKQF